VIQPGILAQAIEGLHGAALRIQTAKDEARDPRLQNRPDAHNTRLQRNIEDSFVETPALKSRGRFLQGQHLRVRHRTLQPFALVMAPGDDPALPYYDRSYGNLFLFRRLGRLPERQIHVKLIAVLAMREKIAHKLRLTIT
jgi:hypothetical protein